MLLKKGSIYRNVSNKEAAVLISQGYEEVKEPKSDVTKKKPAKK